MDEWICEQCGDVYRTADESLDCGWWDWIYGISADTSAEPADRAA